MECRSRSPWFRDRRDAIVRKPEAWTGALKGIELGEGDPLKRPPAATTRSPADRRPQAEELHAVFKLSEKTATSSRFPAELAGTFETSAPLMRFLCGALAVSF